MEIILFPVKLVLAIWGWIGVFVSFLMFVFLIVAVVFGLIANACEWIKILIRKFKNR